MTGRSWVACSTFAVVVAMTTAGCVDGAEIVEEELGTSSNAASGSTLDANATLSRIGSKVKRCEPLARSEIAELWDLRAAFQRPTLDVLVSIRCSLGPSGTLGSASVSVARQGGYSTAGGAFSELSLSSSVNVRVPLRFVALNGGVTYSRTYRTTEDVRFSARTAVGAGVRLDTVVGSVSGSLNLTSTGTSMVSLSIESAAVEVPTSICAAPGARASVGATVRISNPTNASIMIGDINRLLRIDGVNRGLREGGRFTADECVRSRPPGDRL